MNRFFEEAPRSTRELLNIEQQKYNEKLSTYNPKIIKKALKVLEERKKRVKLNEQKGLENEDNLDEETKKVFKLMRNYEQDIKQIFISNSEFITHITDASPENMTGGKISRSINRANRYETGRGDWVFASSHPIDGKNPYIARNPKAGMTLVGTNTYFYNNDNMRIQHDEQGRSRVILRNPNYVYKINPEKFKPVVTLRKYKSQKAFFEFSEEWISEEDVDISDSKQVLGIEEITDITEVIENYQVFCDVHGIGKAIKIRNCTTREEAIKEVFAGIKSGDLRYINGESNINPLYFDDLSKITKNSDEELSSIKESSANKKWLILLQEKLSNLLLLTTQKIKTFFDKQTQGQSVPMLPSADEHFSDNQPTTLLEQIMGCPIEEYLEKCREAKCYWNKEKAEGGKTFPKDRSTDIEH